MSYTEEEAKEKICPFRSGNTQIYCQGSDCMKWLWNRKPKYSNNIIVGYEYIDKGSCSA